MALRYILTATAIVLGCSLTTAEEAVRLERDNLLQFRDSSGKVRTATTTTDWQQRRAEILRGMREVMGKLPSDDRRVPLDVEVDEEVDTGKTRPR